MKQSTVLRPPPGCISPPLIPEVLEILLVTSHSQDCSVQLMEPPSLRWPLGWGCHDVHFRRLPHLHCHPDGVLVKGDFVDGVPTEGAPDDVLTEGDHTDCGLDDGLVVVVLEEVSSRDALEDVLTEEVLKNVPTEEALDDVLTEYCLDEDVLEDDILRGWGRCL